MTTATYDTDLTFSDQETFEMEDLFGADAEFYMQDDETFVVAFPAVEVFGLQRGPGGRLEVVDADMLPNEFDWKSAELFRDSEFPTSADELEFRQADDSIGEQGFIS